MITPRPTVVSEATARQLLQHVTHEKVSVSVSADILAGLLAGIDELSAARAKIAELQGESDDLLLSHLVQVSFADLRGMLHTPNRAPVPIEDMRISNAVPADHFRDVRKMDCRCGPDGCADSTCPGKCSGVSA